MPGCTNGRASSTDSEMPLVHRVGTTVPLPGRTWPAIVTAARWRICFADFQYFKPCSQHINWTELRSVRAPASVNSPVGIRVSRTKRPIVSLQLLQPMNAKQFVTLPSYMKVLKGYVPLASYWVSESMKYGYVDLWQRQYRSNFLEQLYTKNWNPKLTQTRVVTSGVIFSLRHILLLCYSLMLLPGVRRQTATEIDFFQLSTKNPRK